MADKCDVCVLGLIILSSLLTGASVVNDSEMFISSGENVSLPCYNARSDCKSATWIYNSFSHSKTDELIAEGKVKKNTGRLSLGSDCSLNIKSVSEEDYGVYTCRQYVNGQQGTDARVSLRARPRSATPATDSQDPSTINTHGSKAVSTTAVNPVHITNSTIKTPETNAKVIGISIAAVAVLLLALLWLICRKTANNKRGTVDSEVKDENEHKGTNETINMSIPPAARADEHADVTYTEVTFSKKKPVKSINDNDDTVTFAAIGGREDQPQDELYASVNKN